MSQRTKVISRQQPVKKKPATSKLTGRLPQVEPDHCLQPEVRRKGAALSDDARRKGNALDVLGAFVDIKAAVQNRYGQDLSDSSLDNSRKVQQAQVRHILHSQGAQAKLTIGRPDDKYEREADRVADQVMAMPDPRLQHQPENVTEEEAFQARTPAEQITPVIHRQPETDKFAAEEIQTKSKSGETPAVTSGLESRFNSFRGGGQPLDPATRNFFEPRFNYNFSQVRVHTDNTAAETAQAISARAFTLGNYVVMGSGEYHPHSLTGQRLLGHELAHVVQQGAAPQLLGSEVSVTSPVAAEVAHRSIPSVAREVVTIDVEIISSRDEYQPPGSREIYRVGDAAASRILMDIQERSREVVFKVFNFETGVAEEMTPGNWSFYRGAAIIGGSNAGITRLGRQLSPAQWRRLWPNPMPEILRMYEAGRLPQADEALLTGYRGMIRSQASSSLDENERALDDILGVPDRVRLIQEYATGLREASLVRDALLQRRTELSRQLVARHSFSFGLAQPPTGPNMVQRLNIQRDLGGVEDTLAFWLSAFPLLTRLRTQDISTASVESTLRQIKANIVATGQQLNRGRLDPMTLDTVRAHLAGRLGSRATAVVEAEDRSRSRWAIASAVAATAAMIGIMFLPGGVFINAAIGVAIAGHAIANAEEIGRAANTGLHVDDGLVSQSQAQGARFSAILATVFAVVGAAAAGFRVLRVGLALRGLGRSMPELALAERGAVARALADDRALLTAFTRMAPGDAAISARVASAVRHAAGNTRTLRASLQDISRIAAIPRRIPPGSDLYTPLRRITDGSDIRQIARQTGFSQAEVEAAKRNLMLDEHILVDDATGALYRGRFTPFEDVARLWGRAARGEGLTRADRGFLRRLVRHEHAEGALLSASGRTLEQAFLRGELEGLLRTFLRSLRWNQARIDRMLALESTPITPYRYAHIVAHLSGAPNP